MNIRIPHSWLTDHLATKASPQNLQECLSLCGPSVERIEKKGGDAIYDVEVTTNRVDSMSVRGIAREASAILPEFGLKARLKPLPLKEVASAKPLEVTIKNDPKLCHRILAVKLEKVKTGPSPSWLKNRLLLVGQRPLNNVIDITNYVMWEIGHPIHVFDLDRIKTKTIIVREAKKGETLVTLDDKRHTLSGGEVVFDDGKGKIIDLPGIMGTKNTVVTEKTKNILLWIESIDARKIRDASMGLAIRSQAAILNEKQVDPELGLAAIKRAIDLYKNLTGASLASKLVDIYPNRRKAAQINLSQRRIDTYTGTRIAPKKVRRILESLGCLVSEKRGKDGLIYSVTPPTWRVHDITESQDVIEEVTRIYGYHNLPSRLMAGKIPLKDQGIPFSLENRIKDALADWGLVEVYTYSLVSEALVKASEFSQDNLLKLANPLTEDHVFLRRSIIPSHLEVMSVNADAQDFFLFELANVYRKQKGNKRPEEHQQLVITANADLKKTKASVEMLLEKLRIQHLFLAKNGKIKVLDPSRTAMIVSGDRILGKLGEVKPEILKRFDLSAPVTVAVFDAEVLFAASRAFPSYRPLPQHPPVIEDLTFILPEKTYIGELIEEIENTSRLIEAATLKETYRQNATFTITYRHPERSLSDDQIAPVRKKIVKHLKKNFSAKLVGTL